MAEGERRKCLGCDTIIVGRPGERRKRIWCNHPCMHRAKRASGQTPKAPPKAFRAIWYGTCEVCGQLWCGQKMGHKASTCQRDACRKEAKNRKSRAIYAANPAKQAERVRRQRAAWDDETRAREAQRLKTWWAQFPEAMCAVCGKPTGKPIRNDRERRTCSNACRYALRPPDPVREATCLRCGTAFMTDVPKQRYCSKRCTKKVDKERRKIAKRQTGSIIGRVDRALVFTRDDWVCQLCDYPTNPNVKVPDYEAPTIDHIVPIARGGSHTMDNVQTAHHLCNMLKGARLAS